MQTRRFLNSFCVYVWPGLSFGYVVIVMVLVVSLMISETI